MIESAAAAQRELALFQSYGCMIRSLIRAGEMSLSPIFLGSFA